MTTKRCADCFFKFEAARSNTKVCTSCRQGRKDKWRKDKEKTNNLRILEKAKAPARSKVEANKEANKKLVEKTYNEPTPDSDKIQGF